MMKNTRQHISFATHRLLFLSGIGACALIMACSPASPTAPVEAATADAAPKEVAVPPSDQPETHKHTNSLIGETSPYLLQHAHNPVDWYPWGDEALQKAKDEGKPIFLSIGYSACHWCHVMERESFENEEVAAILNAHFISIKVDREERPDLDEIYMTAVQLMTGSGGWPMSVFLTPDQKPFYGGTYYPPEDRFGRPGFKNILNSIAEAWRDRHDEIIAGSLKLTGAMEQVLTERKSSGGELTNALIDGAANSLRDSFDAQEGGFGGAPKFPSAPSIMLLFRQYHRTGDEAMRDMALFTLRKMAHGGVYDHLGGGFHRYSVDAEWLVPHFEKMLYDNAQLVQAYLEAWQITGDPFYARIVRETLDYELRDMQDPLGGFHSTEDADSEGEEGKFYVWDYSEILDILGEEDGALFAAYYNVKPEGNFESHESYHHGKNILHMTGTHEALAEQLNQEPAALEERLIPLRKKLFDARAKRVRPGLDDKILTSWNGLLITALASAAQVLDEPRYRDAAVGAGRFIREKMERDGILLRTHRAGESHLPAYLDDYATCVVAFVDLYEATFDVPWLEAADAYAATMIERFWDTDTFFQTDEAHANVLIRTRPTYDGAEPSGNSMAALGLLRLSKLLDKGDYYDKTRALLEANQSEFRDRPRGYVKMLHAVDFVLNPPREIALVGPLSGDGSVAPFLKTLYGRYVPNKVIAVLDPSAENAVAVQEKLPLLAAKEMIDGKPTAFVCLNFACKKPATDTETFLKQLTEK